MWIVYGFSFALGVWLFVVIVNMLGAGVTAFRDSWAADRLRAAKPKLVIVPAKLSWKYLVIPAAILFVLVLMRFS